MVDRRFFMSSIGKSCVIFAPDFLHSKNISSDEDRKTNQGMSVNPSKRLNFPRDFGAHYLYGIEWWYVTGWLNNDFGEEFAYQLTFFRRKTFIGEKNQSRFSPKHLIFAHATLISKKLEVLKSDQRAGRLGSGLVLCSNVNTNLRFENWIMFRNQNNDRYKIKVESNEFSFEMELQPQTKLKNLILRGDSGYSRKGPEVSQASWYYSRPNLKTNGLITIDKKIFSIQGLSWLDHEWSSELLHPEAVGWDWVGINLIDGGSLMAFRIRKNDGSTIWSDFSMLDANGKKHPWLKQKNISDTTVTAKWSILKEWLSPNSFAKYPISQKITIGQKALTFVPLIENQELDARMTTGGFYWEGAVKLIINEQIFGKGFLELTGYSSPIKLK